MSEIPNLAQIRRWSTPEIPDLGARLYEALRKIASDHSTLAQQVNGSGTGNPTPPPAVQAMTVTGQNGMFDIRIKDSSPIYRGIRYYAEYDTSPAFSAPKRIFMGDSRDHTIFLGNQTLYWRGYSSYIGSGPSAPAYHGGALAPAPVIGGGSIGAPATQPSEGTGTGNGTPAPEGPGIAPFRSTTGAPPARS